eukprot:scaffold529_cov308-Pinguiococcus_pyrenoidosus.AAC.92
MGTAEGFRGVRECSMSSIGTIAQDVRKAFKKYKERTDLAYDEVPEELCDGTVMPPVPLWFGRPPTPQRKLYLRFTENGILPFPPQDLRLDRWSLVVNDGVLCTIARQNRARVKGYVEVSGTECDA